MQAPQGVWQQAKALGGSSARAFFFGKMPKVRRGLADIHAMGPFQASYRPGWTVLFTLSNSAFFARMDAMKFL
ncbi:MAG: hypothetical protein RR860_14170 [Janthinobacterium sp.]